MTPRPLLTASLVVAASLAGCRIFGVVTAEPCADDADCAATDRCVDGSCASEGEGDVGEGEGDVGEGEGDIVVGEGEGDVVVGEGEGDIVVGEGEGEGEGDIVVGEGEGEGGEGERCEGDPNLLDLFITAGAECDPIGQRTLYFTPTPVDSSNNCDLEFTNNGDTPIDVAGVTVTGAGFALRVPVLRTTLLTAQKLTVRLRGTAAAALRAGDVVIEGARDRRLHLLLDPAATGRFTVIRTDDDCRSIVNADVRSDALCAAFITNTGDTTMHVNGVSLDRTDFYAQQIGGASFDLTTHQNGGFFFTAFAFAGNTPSTTFSVTSDGGNPTLVLDSSFATPAVRVVAGGDCSANARCDGLATALNVPRVFTARVENNGVVDLLIDRISSQNVTGATQIRFVSPTPFLLDAGESRDLVLSATSQSAVNWDTVATFADGLGALLQLRATGVTP